jgi:hypothetical protein
MNVFTQDFKKCPETIEKASEIHEKVAGNINCIIDCRSGRQLLKRVSKNSAQIWPNKPNMPVCQIW